MAANNPYNYSMPKGALNRRITPSSSLSSINKRAITGNKSDQYLEQKVMSAKPEELTYMLFEGIIRFLKQAKIHIEDKNTEKSHISIVKAQNIISELRSTLDVKIEISKNLDDLYSYMYDTLLDANINKASDKVDIVIELISDLKDTWKIAMSSL